MAIVIANNYVGDGVFHLQAKIDGPAPKPGQFYMIRTWDMQPLLSRPISVFDYDKSSGEGIISFLYQVVGKGTDKLCHVAVRSDIDINGPYGHGFDMLEKLDTDLVLIGGGIGIAPLHYAAQEFRRHHPEKKVTAYLGYPRTAFGIEFFRNVCDEIKINIGGFITDKVQVKDNDTVLTCGPLPMIDRVNQIIPGHIPVYESLESRMACGFGACLGCVSDIPIVYKDMGFNKHQLVHVANRHEKICTAGPVFLREVV